MVKRMSSKERIQRMAEEARAEELEKTEKPKKKRATAVRKKTVTAATRLKIVWKVFDVNYKEVACFPYPEKEKAYLTASGLTEKKNKNHFVNEVSVPMEGD